MKNTKFIALYNDKFTWIITGLVAGLILDLIIYFLFFLSPGDTPISNIEITSNEAIRNIENNTEIVVPLSHEASSFDFFEELPLFEVDIIPNTDIPDNNSAAIDEKSPSRYVLQVASFNNRYDSERLREELSLTGLESHIETNFIDDEIYYRVLIGPNDNRDELNIIRRNLLNQDIAGIIKTISTE